MNTYKYTGIPVIVFNAFYAIEHLFYFVDFLKLIGAIVAKKTGMQYIKIKAKYNHSL